MALDAKIAACRTTNIEDRDRQALGGGTRKSTAANMDGMWVQAGNLEKAQLADLVMGWS